ncbi:dihydrofolate reductase [Exilibacterium tricleocarpae]|uniref:Dihydrofolate reductase n=1 Tax=Exilibacterium tricleocarpae TaxID=2591008 RepID=A0A545TK88_9GAMM|nr:dihydrofolate reductase [Exilibacterium tricleocarpae]TQV77633.1 dihydrofolate reductase [Exilibacterium tricleocarpae]
MKLAVIAAVAANGVIGRDNQLPWHLPQDLQYFKRVTMGKPVIMGRKTFDSIGRPLPGRDNIVVTRQRDWRAGGVVAVNSLAAALDKAAAVLKAPAAEAMLIGGAQLYAEGLPLARRLYLTRVSARVEGDAFFPDIDLAEWCEVSREDHAAGNDNSLPHAFIVLDRVTNGNR